MLRATITKIHSFKQQSSGSNHQAPLAHEEVIQLPCISSNIMCFYCKVNKLGVSTGIEGHKETIDQKCYFEKKQNRYEFICIYLLVIQDFCSAWSNMYYENVWCMPYVILNYWLHETLLVIQCLITQSTHLCICSNDLFKSKHGQWWGVLANIIDTCALTLSTVVLHKMAKNNK